MDNFNAREIGESGKPNTISGTRLLIRFLLVFALTPIFANAAAIVFQTFINQLVPTESFRLYLDVIQREGILVAAQIVPFPIVTVIILIYLVPVYRGIRNPEDDRHHIGKRRTLNAPLIISLLSLVGWILAIVINHAGVYITGNLEIFQPQIYIPAILNNLIMGGLCFVICFYLLEYLSRIYIIPLQFPDNVLSNVSGVLDLSIFWRFAILFYAISILPALVLSQIVLNLIASLAQDAAELLPGIVIMVMILESIGFVVVVLIARSFAHPLRDMQKVTVAIRTGDFQHSVRVLSTDELGFLSESINVMAEELREKELIKDTFGKAVDPLVRDHLLSGQLALGGELKEVTVLFSDIRSFTGISESHPPEVIVSMLNRYFERMSACVQVEGGTVNKYIGDAIMAIFGAPLEHADHILRAVRAAERMLRANRDLNHELESEGLPVLNTGIGIHTGKVLAGTIGSRDRLEYTVVGDTVNLASRVEGMCKGLGERLLITTEVRAALAKPERARFKGKARVKGRQESIALYALDVE